MQLAWSLDRQVPEWFGQVNERLRAPLNAILATLGLTAVFLFFQSYKDLPTFLATSDHKLEPRRDRVVLDRDGAAQLVPAGRQRDAREVPAARPGAQRTVPQSAAVARASGWIIFPIWIYIFAVIKPIVNGLKGGSALTYLETNGIIDAGLFYLIGLVDLPRDALPLALAPASTRRCCSPSCRRTRPAARS